MHGGYRGGVVHGWGPRYGGWGPGWVLGGIGLGIGLGLGLGNYYYGAPYYAPYPAYVVSGPPPVIYPEAQPVPSVPSVSSAPDPVIYPRNGQSASQLESDRQACNRWATTQPQAMADASVFQRATAACMDGRGYSIR